jgi:NitT/TauT family transport system substrate-binding protein
MTSWKFIAAAALTGAFAATAAVAEPVKIRIHWAQVPGHLAPVIAKVPGHVQPHYGKSYIVVPSFIAGSGPALQALAAGELELSGLSPQSIALAQLEAKLDLRVIGHQFSTEVPGYASSSFWVIKDEIQKIEDLRGKKIGVNARASTIDAAVRTMLLRHGMEDGKDYQIVEVRFPAQFAALKAKRIDLAILLKPNDEPAKTDPTLKPLFSIGDALGPSETITWVGKADWVAKNRAVLVDFIEDSIRFRKWASDPKTQPEAAKIVAEIAKQPLARYAYVYTKEDNYYDPNAMVNVARMQKNIDDLVKIKLLPASIDVSKVVDLSIAREAAARVKTN